MKKIKVILIIFIQCIHGIYAADEQALKKHEEFKSKFDLARFLSLSPHLQKNIAEYCKPNSKQFTKDLKTIYYTYNYKLSEKLEKDLVHEFFYNHVVEYLSNQPVGNDTSQVVPRVVPIIQKPSDLCRIKLSNNWTIVHMAILQNNIDLLSTAIDMKANVVTGDPLSMAKGLKRGATMIKLLFP